MLLSDFLNLVKITRTLYGAEAARSLFESGKDEFSVLSEIDVKNLRSYVLEKKKVVVSN